MKTLVLLAICALAVDATTKPVFEKQSKAATDNARSIGTGRTFSEWGREIMDWFGFGGDYDYYDYSDNYIDDSNHLSSYVSYQPERDDTYDYEEESSWSDMMMNAAMVIGPLGVLLSALPAGVFTFALRRRSLDDDSWFNEASVDTTSLPLLRAIESRDILDIIPELATRSCQEKLFCELSNLGQRDSGSYMQKAFYYTSTLTPKSVSRRLGLGRLFDITKSKQCEVLYCSVGQPQSLQASQALSNELEIPAVVQPGKI